MLQSLKNIFASDQTLNAETQNTEIDILSGLMIEAANTDGEVTQSLNQTICQFLHFLFQHLRFVHLQRYFLKIVTI